MIPLLVAGSVLLLAAALLWAPVRLEVRFREEFSATVKYLFLSFPLTEEPPPEPVKEAAPGGKPAEAGLGKKLKAMLRREGVKGFLQSLQDLAREVKNASRKLLKHVKLKRFDLYVQVGG